MHLPCPGDDPFGALFKHFKNAFLSTCTARRVRSRGCPDVPRHLLNLHSIKCLICPKGPSDKLPQPFVLGCPLWGVSALGLLASEQLLLPATPLCACELVKPEGQLFFANFTLTPRFSQQHHWQRAKQLPCTSLHDHVPAL